MGNHIHSFIHPNANENVGKYIYTYIHCFSMSLNWYNFYSGHLAICLKI